MKVLKFEKNIMDIKEKIKELQELSSESGMNLDKEIESFEQQAKDYQNEIYSHLSISEA